MAESASIIDGVGDEVLLFGVLLCIVTLLLCLWLLRRGSRRNEEPDFRQGGEVEMDQVSDQANEVRSNNLRQRSSLTETTITLRLVTQERTRMVYVPENSTLEDLKRRYFNDESLAGDTIYFIYQGRMLQDTSGTLIELGISDQTSVHVHIRRGTSGQARLDQDRPHEQCDISILFFPLFSVILLLCWAGLLYWPQAFTLFPKLMLFVLSVSFAYLYYRSRLS
ncbi:PREDICTED: uncharacterized protein LOC100641975 [Amphimedon queenslandica]|uniref:Ubiquitin-like domain-containing protein n=1 Tax=Amphimedon queenslandica TaxID=400682 RepID=A0A1X7UFR3_AMPQE|nr:PREDICTED: uncharacterized protein LOC100641975 [Amphimedon queenslandica]|eukprot:XP_003388166.1 PREDICTED: uncharacterized protein LOC100641975 [Amphimedon queenslandica]